MTNIDPLYLEDENIPSYIGTRPKNLFLRFIGCLPIGSSDKFVFYYAVKHNLTIITSDYEFIINILLQSKNVIYQDYYTRHFFKIKKTFVCNDLRYNIFIIKKKDKYFLSKIISYFQKNNIVVLTDSPNLAVSILLKNKKCIFQDQNFVLHYIELEDVFLFEKTHSIHDKPINPYKTKLESDSLQYHLEQLSRLIQHSYELLHFIQELEKQRLKDSLFDNRKKTERESFQLDLSDSNPQLIGIDVLE